MASVQELFEQAQELTRQRQFDQAILLFRQVISDLESSGFAGTNPSVIGDVWYEFGRCFWNKHVNQSPNSHEDVNGALKCYIHSFRLKPDGQCVQYIGDCINRLLDVYDSTTIYIKIPPGPNADLIKGLCNAGSKSLLELKYEVAANQYNTALRYNPDCAVALHGLARALWGLGGSKNRLSGLQAMSKAIALNQDIQPGLLHRVEVAQGGGAARAKESRPKSKGTSMISESQGKEGGLPPAGYVAYFSWFML